MPSLYVNPVPPGTQAKRMDQGQDYQGPVGSSVVAIGDATVDAVKSDPRGFGQAVYYTLTSGPAAGQQIYVGHAQPVVQPGQRIQAGDPVATLVKAGTVGGNASQDGWTEIGLAKNGRPEFSAPTGGQQFASLMKDATIPAASYAGPTDLTQQQPEITPPAGPPAPESTLPLVLPPGTDPQGLWQQVTSQPNISQDTLAYAGNVALAGG